MLREQSSRNTESSSIENLSLRSMNAKDDFHPTLHASTSLDQPMQVRHRAIGATIAPVVEKMVVELRLIFVKIGAIETANERYHADVFLQAAWREPSLDGTAHSEIPIDVNKLWNPRLTVANAIGDPKETVSYEISYRGPDYHTAYCVSRKRIKSVFMEILELHHFPFDCQDLSVTVLSGDYSSDQVELVECPTQLSVIDGSDAISSQEWKLHNHVDVEKFETLNDMDVGPKKRSTMRFTCRVSRRFGFYFFNHILVSVVLCLVSLFSFSVPQSNVLARLQLCFILLLTKGAFKSVVTQNLPKISYLTYLDKLILVDMLVIVLICLWHTISAVVPDTDGEFNNGEAYAALGFGSSYIVFLVLFATMAYFDAGGRRRKMEVADRVFEKRLKTLRGDME